MFANDVEALAALATGVVEAGAAAGVVLATAPPPPLNRVGSANADSIWAIRASTGSSDIHRMIGSAPAKLSGRAPRNGRRGQLGRASLVRFLDGSAYMAPRRG